MSKKLIPVVQSQRPDSAAGASPVFHRIGIVGLGLIGGSIALAARRQWPAALVIGVDARKDVLERAMARHAVDVCADDLVMLREADLVILAVPVGQVIELLPGLPEHVAGEGVVTDTGSTKRAIVAAARALPSRLVFVGGHPLGGAAISGIESARPDLFAGRPWILTPTPETPDPVVDRLRAFVEALGAGARTMSADAHDRVMAAVSHLPQVVVSALMHVVGESAGESGLALSGLGLRDTTRLASSPPAIWRDVARTNADHLEEGIDTLMAVLAELKADLRNGAALERVFESARMWKTKMPESDRKP